MPTAAKKKTFKSSSVKPVSKLRIKATVEFTASREGDDLENIGRELEYWMGDYGHTDWTIDLEEV